MGDYDSLGTVNNEGCPRSHQREIPHKHGLRFDLASVFIHVFRGHEDGSRIGVILGFAFFDGILGGLKLGVGKRQRHGASEVLDRGNFFKNFL